MGVTKALWNEGLLPRVISGASAGSIMTALIGTRTDEEFKEILGGERSLPDDFHLDFFRFSNEIKSKIGRKMQYLVPQGLRWLTSPIFTMLFDKKILNLDTEHFKNVNTNLKSVYFPTLLNINFRLCSITWDYTLFKRHLIALDE
jgi:TAG lipase/steryl ester hydrolase/phospholipase A2/LPA acyltransferase